MVAYLSVNRGAAKVNEVRDVSRKLAPNLIKAREEQPHTRIFLHYDKLVIEDKQWCPFSNSVGIDGRVYEMFKSSLNFVTPHLYILFNYLHSVTQTCGLKQ